MNAIDVLKKPLITEKSTWEGGRHNRYAFQVSADANKHQIASAVEELYGVRVRKIRTQWRKGKYFRTRFGPSKKPDWKKATIELHEDDRIDLF